MKEIQRSRVHEQKKMLVVQLIKSWPGNDLKCSSPCNSVMQQFVRVEVSSYEMP